MHWLKQHKKTIATGIAVIASWILAVLSYLYISHILYRIGFSRFAEATAFLPIPTACYEAVQQTTLIFTGVYDHVAIMIAFVFLEIGLFLAWRAIYTSLNNL